MRNPHGSANSSATTATAMDAMGITIIPGIMLKLALVPGGKPRR